MDKQFPLAIPPRVRDLAKRMISSLVGLLFVCTHAAAAQSAQVEDVEVHPAIYGERADVAEFVEQLVLEHGFDRAEVTSLLAEARYRQDIIEKISKPAERVWTWGRYKRHLVGDERIQKGLEFWRAHQDTLERAHATYGVAPEYVVAILGIETFYGRITGAYPVLDALMTLGFDYPPRSAFFRRELIQFLLLAQEEGKDPRTLMGSYAGAMGYGQFISSSYRHYAVDFSGDGVRDIWADPVDAIGSIANYFAEHRWRGTQPVAIGLSNGQADEGGSGGVELTQTQKQALDALASTNPSPKHSLGSIRALGLEKHLPSADALDDATKLAVFKLNEGLDADDPSAPVAYWLGLHDFYVITRYNHSHLYALAVEHIARALKAGMREEMSEQHAQY